MPVSCSRSSPIFSTTHSQPGYTCFFFFLNDPPTPEFSPLPLHAPLPIWISPAPSASACCAHSSASTPVGVRPPCIKTSQRGEPSGFSPTRFGSIATTTHCRPNCSAASRSEEHTSELQSQSNLVCRLLLEK